MVPEEAATNAAVSGEQAIASAVEAISRQAVQIQSSAKTLAASAGSGFHIEPQAAFTLIKACRQSAQELEELETQLQTIKQAPKLGETPGAKVVSKFTQKVATDPQGMIPAVNSLKRTLHDMADAYQKASTNYAETEELVANWLKNSAPQ